MKLKQNFGRRVAIMFFMCVRNAWLTTCMLAERQLIAQTLFGSPTESFRGDDHTCFDKQFCIEHGIACKQQRLKLWWVYWRACSNIAVWILTDTITICFFCVV